MGRRELGCTVHKCRKGLDSWWRFGSGEANVSINDVITEGGKAWEESRVTRKTEVQGGFVQGKVLFFTELRFRKAFLRE